MSSILPDTDNFFKYILTIGVLMVLFGLIYPLKQEQGLRTKRIEIKENDSLLRIEITYLEIQVNDLDTLQKRTQLKVDDLKKKRKHVSFAQQTKIDERIAALVDNFYSKRSSGLLAAKDVKLKKAKLSYEQQQYIETSKQVSEYFWFRSTFWGLGIVLTLAGLFFWMDSTYYDELVKISGQSTYQSKYAQCVSFFYLRYKWFIGLITLAVILIVIYFFLFRPDFTI